MSAFARLNLKKSSSDDDEFSIGYSKDPGSDSEDLAIKLLQSHSKVEESSNSSEDDEEYETPSEYIGKPPSLIRDSKFDTHNVAFSDNYATITLKNGDRLVLKGKYQLHVLKGTVRIDGAVLHPGKDAEVNACSLDALPVIYPICRVGETTQKAVVKINSWIDGADKIGVLYPQLQSIYQIDQPNNRFPLRDSFSEYSFCPLVNSEGGDYGTTIPDDWRFQLGLLTNDLNDNSRILMVGGKNSGKSTFLRLLLNNLVTTTDKEIYILDLDPGQSEYSIPGCISLTKHDTPIFGTHFPFRNGSRDDHVEFIGSSTPQWLPQSYLTKMKHLISMIPPNKPVLINTPGWIQGFGVEIFKGLSSVMHITELLYFTNSTRRDRDVQVIGEIKYDRCVHISGFHISEDSGARKYASSQKRHFKELSYFHYQQQTDSFNFEPLLLKSPYQISYGDDYQGVSLIALADTNSNINIGDIDDCLVFQIVGIFLQPNKGFQSLIGGIPNLLQKDGYPNIALNCSDILDEAQLQFIGLGLVHSIDRSRKVINIYTPIEPETITSQLTNNRLIMVKQGHMGLPVEEMYPTTIYESGKVDTTGSTKKHVPYVSFNTDTGKGGKPVNVRRNIQRRGLAH